MIPTISQVLSLIVLITVTSVVAIAPDSQFRLQTEVQGLPVPVQLGVMSRCPDALACESVFDQVWKEVGQQKMNLSLIYVARLNSTDKDFGVTCMHGPGECAGNIQQLCVAKYATPSTWWNFIQCQNAHGRYRVGEPELTLQCAANVGFDWKSSEIGACAGLDVSGKGTEGIQLLRQSLLLGKALHIQKSCTVLINGKKVCVRDGTWDCDGGHDVEDFVEIINREYDKINEGVI
ncbi:hypothetical protein R3P38DRAFT_3490620 [Favolaschia claudopus]|uniref:Uncharacterized protein n=1 Tax=Favolaschia claudopus TaxID=2862362 RepID=A0AAW0EBZ7_9AGAR